MVYFFAFQDFSFVFFFSGGGKGTVGTLRQGYATMVLLVPFVIFFGDASVFACLPFLFVHLWCSAVGTFHFLDDECIAGRETKMSTNRTNTTLHMRIIRLSYSSFVCTANRYPLYSSSCSCSPLKRRSLFIHF